MAASDVPLFYFLDPSFWAFLILLAIGYGVWRLAAIVREWWSSR